MKGEARTHCLALLALLGLNTSAIARFNPTPAAARRALWLLALIVPLSVFAAAIGDTPWRQGGQPYFIIRSLQVLAATLAPLPLVWLLCRVQRMQQHYALYVTVYLWLCLFWAFYGALANGLTADVPFEITTIKAVGTTLFFVSYASHAYIAALALRCNPFVAVGVATLVSFCAAVSSDLSNLYLFGVARPLFSL